MTLRYLPGFVALLLAPLATVAVLAVAVAAVDGPWWGWCLAGLALGSLLRGLVRWRRLTVDVEDGLVAVTRWQAPDLWSVVDDVARVVGTRPPNRMLLTLEPNAAVYDEGDTRLVILGLPIVAAFTVGEVRSVVAHELGHLAAPEPRAYRRLVLAVSDASSVGGVLAWIASATLAVHALAHAATSRHVEQRADVFCLRAATLDEARGALLVTPRAAIVWSYAMGTYAELIPASRILPPLSRSLRAALAEPPVAFLEDDADRAGSRRRPWESHPSPQVRAQRLATLDLPPDAPTDPDPRPAIDLIPADVLADAEATLLGEADVHPGTMADAADHGGAALLALAVSQVALDHGLLGRQTYGDVIRALGDGAEPQDEVTPVVVSPSLVERMAHEISPAVEGLDDDRRADTFAPVVAAGLVAAGAGRVVVRWPGVGIELVDGRDAELHAPLRAAGTWADAAATAARLLADLGGDPGLALGEGRPMVESTLVAAAEATGPWEGRRTLAVLTTGLVALPADPPPADVEALRWAARRDPELLRAEPGAWWLPFSDIVSAHVEGRVVTTLEATLRGGQVITVRSDATRSLTGVEVRERLRLLLRDRLRT